MQHLQHIGFIRLPKYPRRVKLSNKQNAKYWEWNGETIKCGSKKLLQKYIDPVHKEDIIMNNGNVKSEYLKKGYSLVAFIGNVPKFIWDNKLTGDFIINRNKNPKGKTKDFLCSIEKVGDEFHIEKVIANSTQAGTPKYHIISGQDDHVRQSPFIRNKIVNTLHEYYYETLNTNYSLLNLSSIRSKLNDNYPLYIVFELRDTVKNVFDNSKNDIGRRWDVGNRLLPYNKTFLDFLTRGYKDGDEVLMKPFIEDDDRLHVVSANNGFFTPIEDETFRCIKVHFYKDTRECFNKYLNNDND